MPVCRDSVGWTIHFCLNLFIFPNITGSEYLNVPKDFYTKINTNDVA